MVCISSDLMDEGCTLKCLIFREINLNIDEFYLLSKWINLKFCNIKLLITSCLISSKLYSTHTIMTHHISYI